MVYRYVHLKMDYINCLLQIFTCLLYFVLVKYCVRVSRCWRFVSNDKGILLLLCLHRTSDNCWNDINALKHATNQAQPEDPLSFGLEKFLLILIANVYARLQYAAHNTSDEISNFNCFQHFKKNNKLIPERTIW
jgi:hypothetical protein